MIISSETSNENAEEFIKITKEVLGNKEKYITQKRFDVVKKHIEISHVKQEIERYSYPNKYINTLNWSYDKLFKQKDFNLQKVYEICDKYFDFDKFYVSTDKNEYFTNNK